MFWKMKQGVLILDRDKIQVVGDHARSQSLFLFPDALVHNLELIDQMGFEKLFYQFLEKESIAHTEVTIVLNESFLFWKKCTPDANESDFFSRIPLPLDQQTHKKIPVENNLFLSAHNGALVGAVQRVLHSKKNTITSIVPFFAFPAFESGQVDTMNMDMSSIRKVCRYDSEILKLRFVSPQLSTPVLICSLCIALLIASAGGAYFWYMRQPNKSKQIVTKKIKKSPSPTPTIIFLNPKDITIEIKNGSSRFGEAGRLKDTLEKADYKVTSVDNAEKDISATEVDAKTTVPDDYISRLTALLGEQYTMSSDSAKLPESTASADIIITIGIDPAR